MNGTCKSTGRWRGGGDEGTYVSTVWLDVGIKIAQFLQSLAKILPQLGQLRGSVGRAVASHSRGQGSNPVIGKNLYWTFYYQLYWKDEKRKRGQNWPVF